MGFQNWQNVQEKLQELEEQLQSRFESRHDVDTNGPDDVNDLSEAPDDGQTPDAARGRVRRQLPAVQKPPALPSLPQQLNWPFTPSPLQCGAEYRAALAMGRPWNPGAQTQWPTEPTTLESLEAVDRWEAPVTVSPAPHVPHVPRAGGGLMASPATPRQREWALLSGGACTPQTNDQAFECLQLVADVDGALRSMEHWVATARDGASGASGPTEATYSAKQSASSIFDHPSDELKSLAFLAWQRAAPAGPAGPAGRHDRLTLSGGSALLRRVLSRCWNVQKQAAFSLWRCAMTSQQAIRSSQEQLAALEATAGRTCVRYAVLANAGLACASICQGRLLRLWFWKAWRLSLASNRREREGREVVREAISRVLNLSCEDYYQNLKAFQAWARSVATAHCFQKMRQHQDVLGRYQRLTLATETVTTALEDEKNALWCTLILKTWHANLKSSDGGAEWLHQQELQQVHRELHAERQLRRRLQEEVEQLKGTGVAPASAESRQEINDTRRSKLREEEARLQEEFHQLSLQRDELQKMQRKFNETRRIEAVSSSKNASAKANAPQTEEVQPPEPETSPGSPTPEDGKYQSYQSDKLRSMKLNELTLDLLSVKAQLDEDTAKNSQRWILHVEILDKLLQRRSWYFCGVVSLMLRSWSKRAKLMCTGPFPWQLRRLRISFGAWRRMHDQNRVQKLAVRAFSHRSRQRLATNAFLTWCRAVDDPLVRVDTSLPAVTQDNGARKSEAVQTDRLQSREQIVQTHGSSPSRKALKTAVVHTDPVHEPWPSYSGAEMQDAQSLATAESEHSPCTVAKVVQVDMVSAVSAGKLPCVSEVKVIQTEAVDLTDLEDLPHTDVKLVQTDTACARRLPVSTDAKVVQTEAETDEEQRRATDVKVVQTETVSSGRLRLSSEAKLVQTELFHDSEHSPCTVAKVVQTDMVSAVSAGKLPCVSEVKVIQTEAVDLTDLEDLPHTDVKLVQTDTACARRLPVSTNAKVVQTEAETDEEQRRLTDVKTAQTASFFAQRSPLSTGARAELVSGLADREQSSSTDAKSPQTATFFSQRSPVSTDAKVVRAEAVADMEQSSSTDMKVASGSLSASRSPVSIDAKIVQTEAADLECPSTTRKLVHTQFLVQSEQPPMASAVAPVAPCPAESLPATLVAPGIASSPPLRSGSAELELVSTSEMKFVQCLAGKVEAAARVKQARQAPSQRPRASPWYAIDLEAQVVRPLSAKPASPKPPRVPQAAGGSARLHAKLMRQAEAARSRVAQSDISLRQLKAAAEPRRIPSKPPSPRRCPWHGSGAAAVSGVAPLYYEGPDCEFTSSALLSLEASLDEIGR